MMKIVFLDIAGCLNTSRSVKLTGSSVVNSQGKSIYLCPLDFEAVSNLNEITSKMSASIVISSTWRIPFVHYGMYEDLKRYLKSQGVVAEIIGYTPTPEEYAPGCDLISSSLSRGEEINLWLQSNKPESFVIFDDNSDIDPFKDRWIQTSFTFGITKQLANKAEKILDSNVVW